MSRNIRLVVIILVLALAGLYLREYFFVIRTVEINATPTTIYPGDSSLVIVYFLNGAGTRVPFAHRKVDFEIMQGEEHCAMEDAKNPEEIYIHALSPGDVIIHIRVDGFVLPFETRIRIVQPLS